MAKMTPIQERYRATMIHLADKRSESEVKKNRGLFWTAVILIVCGTILLAPCIIGVLK